MLNAISYEAYFGSDKKEISRQYVDLASDADYERFSVLGSDVTDIDTPLEFALLSYYSQPVINIRPVEAKNILPANNKTSELKLGAAVYQEMQILRFLGNTDAVGRHEGMIKFITDRGNVNRAEIEKYLKDGIAEVVNAEFNKTIFLMDRRYTAVLTRDFKTGGYELSYEDANYVTKQITASSLNALLTEMRSGTKKADFNQNCIDQVNARNANIPAVFLEKTGKDPRADLAAIITAFYLNPTNQTAYGAVRDVNVFYDVAAGVSDNPTNRAMYETIGFAYINTLTALSPELKQRVINDSRGRTSITLSVDVRNRLQFASLRQ
jgi:hypothetical protein